MYNKEVTQKYRSVISSLKDDMITDVEKADISKELITLGYEFNDNDRRFRTSMKLVGASFRKATNTQAKADFGYTLLGLTDHIGNPVDMKEKQYVQIVRSMAAFVEETSQNRDPYTSKDHAQVLNDVLRDHRKITLKDPATTKKPYRNPALAPAINALLVSGFYHGDVSQGQHIIWEASELLLEAVEENMMTTKEIDSVVTTFTKTLHPHHPAIEAQSRALRYFRKGVDHFNSFSEVSDNEVGYRLSEVQAQNVMETIELFSINTPSVLTLETPAQTRLNQQAHYEVVANLYGFFPR